jgi:hypothetical protein
LVQIEWDPFLSGLQGTIVVGPVLTKSNHRFSFPWWYSDSSNGR